MCDQLSVVRLEKAKKSRSGDDLIPHKEFTVIDPIVIAMWHTKQDYVEVKYLMKSISDAAEFHTIMNLHNRLYTEIVKNYSNCIILNR